MQLAINNFIKNLRISSDTVIFISDKLLGLKFISIFQYAAAIHINNNLFNAYKVYHNDKRFIVINTSFSFYLIIEILKSLHLQEIKNIIYIQNVPTIDKINIITEAFLYYNEKIKVIKNQSGFFNNFIKNCNNENFILSKSLTLPFDVYLNNKIKNIKDIMKNENINIQEFFNYYFYYYLELNNLSGLAINVAEDISVYKLLLILNCFINTIK